MSLSTSDDELGGILGERVYFEETAKALFSLIPPGFERIELRMRSLVGYNSASARTVRADGTRDSVKNIKIATDAAKRLREAMYREGAGTWFSVLFVVTVEGKVDVAYNYDEEPEWKYPIDPVLYVQDLEKFPRDPENVPEWLQKRVFEAEAEAR
ncbi:hypothetical protein [Agreia pratensis]|uniref:Uncharacterized protein n=1 Tax=Agreia pratensis TaxID=150121 RepID=A0A1X7JUL2_9MICO|nr:hypothetical protein [Agreia pratensis]SMG32071.1 hypothetical protein SAMN06296010_1881 [Agreia pratensis]